MKRSKLFQAVFGSRNTATARFSVQGMNCASCVTRVEQAVHHWPGVSSVKVDLAAGRVTVEHDPSRVTAERLRQQITTAGYVATELAQ